MQTIPTHMADVIWFKVIVHKLILRNNQTLVNFIVFLCKRLKKECEITVRCDTQLLKSNNQMHAIIIWFVVLNNELSCCFCYISFCQGVFVFCCMVCYMLSNLPDNKEDDTGWYKKEKTDTITDKRHVHHRMEVL